MTDSEGPIPQVRQILEGLRSSFHSEIYASSFSTYAKNPFKVAIYLEGLLRRAEELGRSACDCYERGDLVSGVLLERGLVETSAACWYLQELIQKKIENPLDDGLNKKMMNLLVGSRMEGLSNYKAENILNFVDRADKKFPGFRVAYDSMSEVSHPNWGGVVGAYSKADKKEFLVKFEKIRNVRGRNLRGNIKSLKHTLLLFVLSHDKIVRNMRDLIKICEAEIER